MQIVAEPRQEVKNLAKVILSADDQSISWFNIGGWYVDCLWTAVLTLPDGDPTLEQMLKGINQGSRENIVHNLLRMEIAREETAEFVGKLPAPLVVLARASLHRMAAPQEPEVTQDQIDNASINFCLITLKVAAGFFRLLPSMAWIAAKRRFRNLLKIGGRIGQ